jgi:proline dehydrogenase
MKPAPLYGTEPPAVAKRSIKRRMGEIASHALMPILKYAARPYLGGETVEDALCVAARLAREGHAVAFSHWDIGSESAAEIEAIGLDAMTALSGTAYESYLALKPPALHFSRPAARRLASASKAHGIRLHFDSHGADVVDLQTAMLAEMLEVVGPECLGTTIPGRLDRSPDDAEWAIARGLAVRVVKGEWPEPGVAPCDLRKKFLDVIDQLAGRARHVAVATHDLVLGQAAIHRLRAADTACEIEVLLGMPADPLLAWAKSNDVRTRVYVPYGRGFIPNAVGILRHNPRLALTIARAQLVPGRAQRGQNALTSPLPK